MAGFLDNLKNKLSVVSDSAQRVMRGKLGMVWADEYEELGDKPEEIIRREESRKRLEDMRESRVRLVRSMLKSPLFIPIRKRRKDILTISFMIEDAARLPVSVEYSVTHDDMRKWLATDPDEPDSLAVFMGKDVGNRANNPWKRVEKRTAIVAAKLIDEIKEKNGDLAQYWKKATDADLLAAFVEFLRKSGILNEKIEFIVGKDSFSKSGSDDIVSNAEKNVSLRKIFRDRFVRIENVYMCGFLTPDSERYSMMLTDMSVMPDEDIERMFGKDMAEKIIHETNDLVHAFMRIGGVFVTATCMCPDRDSVEFNEKAEVVGWNESPTAVRIHAWAENFDMAVAKLAEAAIDAMTGVFEKARDRKFENLEG